MIFGLLSGCFGRSYVIGKNPPLDEITSVFVGGGGTELNSSWSYSAFRSSSSGTCKLNRVWWDEDRNDMSDVTVEISSYDYQKILESIDGLSYVKKDTSSNTMDGDSQQAIIYWAKNPSGSYCIDFGDDGMRGLLTALEEIWNANAYKANEPADISGITYFSFSFGPTDIANGDIAFSAELDEESGDILLTFKEREQSMEEAGTTRVSSSFMSEIERIVKEDGADRWNGFSGEDSFVYDGSAFYLMIITSSGSMLNAHGRECYPDGYRGFEHDITELFKTAFGQ